MLIVGYVDDPFKPLIANFGFLPRAIQKERIEAARAAGKTPRVMRTVMNVRDDNVGKSRLFAPAWRAGGRCLIPAKYVGEPSYPQACQDEDGEGALGPCVWRHIGMICGQYLWRRSPGLHSGGNRSFRPHKRWNRIENLAGSFREEESREEIGRAEMDQCRLT
ncbi:hypothetical protein WS84_07325 [Burkholderia anthina]|uniref:hypothetical protein n=1 Tax=Burkholderia anthina TaxID=179879 RepID=UPI00075D0C22|nr:hypothetical protein [Burkholderia anthina]KVH13536.1 hypothetical protein WS84_07325 [Burkholderia anthina]KVH14169.1 hypothetical protein WS85_06210 [Burkholderia anthina]KVM85029.1 hypothetical protein WT06_25870 [Burkholderia anthina]KVX32313.1 hypothetical protein WT32_20310 [Burkholderia anthina]